LVLIGLYQLIYADTPAFAAIHEVVEAAKILKKNWATGVINGVLRNFTRQKTSLLPEVKAPSALFAHPEWFIKMVKSAWPEQWQTILEQNNQHPPMTLRVNRQQISREDYLQLLQEAQLEANVCVASEVGISLVNPVSVSQLPGFSTGLCSIQDEAAQLAATLLELTPHLRVLDACAAPGGKTSHILEAEPSSQVLAVEQDAERAAKITENLTRLQLAVKVKVADATLPEAWWDKELFDRILVDAPCSATGVIRRHPDIKILRRATDIKTLAQLQLTLLEKLWPLLAVGGILVYATCSILPAENDDVIQAFMKKTANGKLLPIDATWGLATSCGRQLLPGDTDGFYYARLQKI
jgi:16S rRNA (cytosine967-C5)-methyltransferase